MTLTARSPSQQLIDLVGALGGTWHGLTAMCRCPAHADRTPSLSLRQGDRDMLVTCFAGCHRDDVLRALAKVPLNGRYSPPIVEHATGRGNVERLWAEAEAIRSALPVRYLASRGFDEPPPDLRFHPRCPHGPKPRTVFKPAILVAVRERRDLVAVQRIFLDPITARYTAKVMLGRPFGGAWRGRAAVGTLALAEGFETAEAYSLLFGMPCWAALGARRLDQITLPDNLHTLILAEDPDAEGRRAAENAAAGYARPGLHIRRHPPSAPREDWAQVLVRAKRGGGSKE